MSMQATEDLRSLAPPSFFVKGNGDSVVQNRGILTEREIAKIQDFIKDNYEKMYEKWALYSENGFYRG